MKHNKKEVYQEWFDAGFSIISVPQKPAPAKIVLKPFSQMILEILFASTEPLTANDIAKMLGTSGHSVNAAFTRAFVMRGLGYREVKETPLLKKPYKVLVLTEKGRAIAKQVE